MPVPVKVRALLVSARLTRRKTGRIMDGETNGGQEATQGAQDQAQQQGDTSRLLARSAAATSDCETPPFASIRRIFFFLDMGTSPFRVSAPALRAPLSRILGAVPFEPISGTAGADRRYQLLLTRVTKQGYYSPASSIGTGEARPIRNRR